MCLCLLQESDRPATVQCFSGLPELQGRQEHHKGGERSTACAPNEGHTKNSDHTECNDADKGNSDDTNKAGHAHHSSEHNGLHYETAFVDDSFALRGGGYEEGVGEKRFKTSSGSEPWMQAVVAAMNEPWPAVPEIGEKSKQESREGKHSEHGERENGRTAEGKNGQVAQGREDERGDERNGHAGSRLAKENGASNAAGLGSDSEGHAVQNGLKKEDVEEEPVCHVYEARLHR